MIDTCVICGEIVPEGTQVCWKCKKDNEKEANHNSIDKQKRKGRAT